LFPQQNSLRAATRAQLVEGPAAMGFDGVLTHEKPVADLAVAQTLSDQAENLQLTRRNAKSVELRLVQRKRSRRLSRNQDLAEDNPFPRLSQLDAQPDAEACKDDRNKGAIDFDGVLDDEEPILRPPQDGDQDAANEAEDENVAWHVSGFYPARPLSETSDLVLCRAKPSPRNKAQS